MSPLMPVAWMAVTSCRIERPVRGHVDEAGEGVRQRPQSGFVGDEAESAVEIADAVGPVSMVGVLDGHTQPDTRLDLIPEGRQQLGNAIVRRRMNRGPRRRISLEVDRHAAYVVEGGDVGGGTRVAAAD
jgi:hypothetical protein